MFLFHSILILCSIYFILFLSPFHSTIVIGLQPRGMNFSEYGTRGWYTTFTQEPGCGVTRRKLDDNSDQISSSIFYYWNLQTSTIQYNLTWAEKLNTTVNYSTQSLLDWQLNKFISAGCSYSLYSWSTTILCIHVVQPWILENVTLEMWKRDTEYSDVNVLSSC